MSLKKNAISILNKLPYVRGLYREHLEFNKNSCFQPGHYYSSIVSVDELRENAGKIWPEIEMAQIPGIDLNDQIQLSLVADFERFYDEIPFPTEKSDLHRYYFGNDYYSYTDAIFLYSIIRKFSPKQIIEIGSGFSSAVMLDTNQQFFGNKIKLTFIEPYTERLRSLLTSKDASETTIIEQNVQKVNLHIFEKLNAGDILFVDSSHVVKTGSDVNFILFEILPKLKSGVLIHFHDIFFPFEYPKQWVLEGRNWNEDYFLKAFLMYNNQFEIFLFSDYLHKHHPNVFQNLPLCYKNAGGNLWLKKK